jgi:hypothetical protein
VRQWQAQPPPQHPPPPDGADMTSPLLFIPKTESLRMMSFPAQAGHATAAAEAVPATYRSKSEPQARQRYS